MLVSIAIHARLDPLRYHQRLIGPRSSVGAIALAPTPASATGAPLNRRFSALAATKAGP